VQLYYSGSLDHIKCIYYVYDLRVEVIVVVVVVVAVVVEVEIVVV